MPQADLTPALKKLIQTQPKSSISQFTLETQSFVKNWTLKDFAGDLNAEVKSGATSRMVEKWLAPVRVMSAIALRGRGAVGPDLSAAGGKFSAYDLLEAIIDPGKEISDQYGATNFKMKDGSVISGRIMNLSEDRYQVNTDMMNPSSNTLVDVNDLVSIEPSRISMMPAGLINTMSKDDVFDLLAYLISAGDPKHPALRNEGLGLYARSKRQECTEMIKYFVQS